MIDAFLSTGRLLHNWQEEWFGVPLAGAWYEGESAPPRDVLGSVRGIGLSADGVVIAANPGPQIIFGGRAEPGETVEDALRREFAEETGWIVEPVAIRGFLHWRHRDAQRPDWGRPWPDFIDVIYVAGLVRFDGSLLLEGEAPSSLVRFADVPELGDLQTHVLADARAIWAAGARQ